MSRDAALDLVATVLARALSRAADSHECQESSASDDAKSIRTAELTNVGAR